MTPAGPPPALQCSDPDQLQRLVAYHTPLVASVCRRCLSDPGLAADATQAVFIVLSRKGDRIRDPRALPGWLHRTAVRICVRLDRAAIRRRHHEQEAAMLVAREATAGAVDAADAADADLERIRPLLDAAVTALRPTQRSAVIGFYLEGKPQAQVAQELGCSEAAVRMRLQEALKRLRIFLARRGVTTAAAGLVGALTSATSEAVEPSLLADSAAAALGRASVRARAIADTDLKYQLFLKTMIIGSVGLACAGVLAVVMLNAPATLQPAEPTRFAETGSPPTEGAVATTPSIDLERLLALRLPVRFCHDNLFDALREIARRCPPDLPLQVALPMNTMTWPYQYDGGLADGWTWRPAEGTATVRESLDALCAAFGLRWQTFDGRIVLDRPLPTDRRAELLTRLNGVPPGPVVRTPFGNGVPFMALTRVLGLQEQEVVNALRDREIALVALRLALDGPQPISAACAKAFNSGWFDNGFAEARTYLVDPLAAAGSDQGIADAARAAIRPETDEDRLILALRLVALAPRPGDSALVMSALPKRMPEIGGDTCFRTGIQTLGVIGDHTALAWLRLVAAKEAKPEEKNGERDMRGVLCDVRLASLRCMGADDSPPAITGPDAQSQAVALSRWGDKRAQVVFQAHLKIGEGGAQWKSDSPGVRQAIVDGCTSPEVAPLILAMLDSPDLDMSLVGPLAAAAVRCGSAATYGQVIIRLAQIMPRLDALPKDTYGVAPADSVMFDFRAEVQRNPDRPVLVNALMAAVGDPAQEIHVFAMSVQALASLRDDRVTNSLLDLAEHTDRARTQLIIGSLFTALDPTLSARICQLLDAGKISWEELGDSGRGAMCDRTLAHRYLNDLASRCPPEDFANRVFNLGIPPDLIRERSHDRRRPDWERGGIILSQVGTTRAIEPPVDLLDDKSPYVRACASYAVTRVDLGRLGQYPNPVTIGMLDSPDPVVRAYGIAGMAEPNPIDDSHDSQLLAKCITTDADPRVRALAILWTSMRNGPALVAARHVAKADPDPMVQQALFQIQGRGLDIAVDPTSENLGHTSPRQVPRHKDWPLVESRGQGRRILPPRWSPEGMQWPFGNG